MIKNAQMTMNVRIMLAYSVERLVELENVSVMIFIISDDFVN
jgi:hypothetical protein